MLTYQTHLGYGFGADASDPNVVLLQKALKELSVASNDGTIDPGSTNGLVDLPTSLAVANALNVLTPQLDGTTALILKAGILGASFSDTVDSKTQALIKSYAPQLTIAAKNATAYLKTKGGDTGIHRVINIQPGSGGSSGGMVAPGLPTATTSSIFSSPWFWIGTVAGIGAIIGTIFLIRRKPSAPTHGAHYGHGDYYDGW